MARPSWLRHSSRQISYPHSRTPSLCRLGWIPTGLEFVEIPPCPRPGHEKSVVVRAGWYGRQGQRRQRWKCTPGTGEVHRFAEVLPRIVSGAAEHVCPDCATSLEPWEGQPAPRLYGFSARDVAAALVMVAGGASYRQTAEAIRVRAGRPLAGCSAAEPVEEEGPQGQGAPAREPASAAGLGLGGGLRADHLGRLRRRGSGRHRWPSTSASSATASRASLVGTGRSRCSPRSATKPLGGHTWR